MPRDGFRFRWWGPRVAIALVVVAAAVAVVMALVGPWAGVFIRMSLPRQHGDLQVLEYRRGGPPPESPEGIRFCLPPEAAHGWFMAAVGHALPAAVAVPGSVLWGELRGPTVGAPLPVQVVSDAPGSGPRVDLTLGDQRVDGWLLDAAKREHSAWVVRVAAGSRLSDAGMGAPDDWDLRLRLVVSGMAARRDGQPGLVWVEALEGLIDLRWSAGTHDTRVDARIRLERLRLRDGRSGSAGEVPAVVLDLVAGMINAGLRDRPPVLPFVVLRATRLSLEVVESAVTPTQVP